MKKILMFALFSALFMCSCSKDDETTKPVEPIVAESIKLDKTKLVFIDGGEAQMLIATILPKEAEDKTITWTSSEETIATVTEGLVKVYQAGECTITATTVNDLKATCKVIVNEAPVPVTDIMTELDDYTTKVGEELTIVTTVYPENADDTSYTITIEDNSVLTQKENIEGNVFNILSSGTSKITFTSVSDNTISATCIVTVMEDTSMTDEKDGKKYNTVTIGDQVWMSENYAYLGDDSHTDLIVPLDDMYDNDDAAYIYVYKYEGTNMDEAKESNHYKEFGAFYNFKSAKEFAPTGWHLPTKADWVKLQKFIKMTDEEISNWWGYGQRGTVADKLKEKGTWTGNWTGNPEDFANNLTGFSAKAAGTSYTQTAPYIRAWDGVTFVADWWADEVNPIDDSSSCQYGVVSHSVFVWRCYVPKSRAQSVRYIKDTE